MLNKNNYEFIHGQDHDWWIYDNTTDMVAPTFMYDEDEDKVKTLFFSNQLQLQWIPYPDFDI